MKVLGRLVILEERFAFVVFPVVCVEDVQRTVVAIAFHVVGEVFHLHADSVAIVVLAALEPLVTVLLGEALGRRSSRCKVEEGKDVGGSIEGEKVASGMGKGVCLRGRGDVGELEGGVG